MQGLVSGSMSAMLPPALEPIIDEFTVLLLPLVRYLS